MPASWYWPRSSTVKGYDYMCVSRSSIKEYHTDTTASPVEIKDKKDQWLVATIRYQLQQQGMSSDWRKIVRTMNIQKCVTTSLVNIKNEAISIRQCTEPAKEVKKVYDFIKYKYAHFVKKKSIVPPAEIF